MYNVRKTLPTTRKKNMAIKFLWRGMKHPSWRSKDDVSLSSFSPAGRLDSQGFSTVSQTASSLTSSLIQYNESFLTSRWNPHQSAKSKKRLECIFWGKYVGDAGSHRRLSRSAVVEQPVLVKMGVSRWEFHFSSSILLCWTEYRYSTVIGTQIRSEFKCDAANYKNDIKKTNILLFLFENFIFLFEFSDKS